MKTFSFPCSNKSCSEEIVVLESQSGGKVSCSSCLELVSVPKITFSEISNSSNEDAKFSNKDFEEVKFEDRSSSFLNKLYIGIGNLVDKYLDIENDVDGFKGKLQDARRKYLELSEFRKRHVTFFITSIVVFVVVLVVSTNISYAITGTLVWITFIALNRIKILDHYIRWSVKVSIWILSFWLPTFIRNPITSISKYLFVGAASILLYWLVGPIYIIYKSYLIYADDTEV